MADINSNQKAPILDENGTQLDDAGYGLHSSDTGVLSVEVQASGWFAVAVSVGSATLDATRNADGVHATLEVNVAAAPFAISLGTAEPK